MSDTLTRAMAREDVIRERVRKYNAKIARQDSAR